MSAASPQTQPPRGALVVIAVGLIACLAAALLTQGKGEGEAAEVEWVQKTPLPDSKPARVPGGKGQFRLADAGIRASGTNASGFELVRAAAVLRIDAGSPVGEARIRCFTDGPPESEVAQTPKSRASYPRSSPDLIKQPVPENVVVEFSSHGTDLALLGFGDVFDGFTEERGIKVEWPPYRVAREQWEWFLPPGKPSKPLELGFASIWRTTAVPAVDLSCKLTTAAGSASVKTSGALPEKSEAIAE